MNACKSYRARIALMSVQALDEREIATVRIHLRCCKGCRQYAARLETVVGLYTEHADAPVASVPARLRILELAPLPWYKRLLASPATAAAAAVVCVAAFLLSKPGGRPAPQPSIATTAVAAPPPKPVIPTIGNARHLALDELTQPPRIPGSRPAEFVFSVRTRDDGS